ncbi:hypothetical protein Q3G72_008847 [Acer saccharum]|nr:hypothetical protein Q3G72_008847 [Acer saccharum]
MNDLGFREDSSDLQSQPPTQTHSANQVNEPFLNGCAHNNTVTDPLLFLGFSADKAKMNLYGTEFVRFVENLLDMSESFTQVMKPIDLIVKLYTSALLIKELL